MPPVESPAGTDRSLSRLGLAAFTLFLLGAFALGVALREENEGAGREARVEPSEAAAKPNVVVLMTDDQTLSQMRAMPHTKRLLARTGVRFDRFYVTDPLSSPSRATFLTGQYAHNSGVISNRDPTALSALEEDDTLGVWLQNAGYRTAFVGEYLSGYGGEEGEQVPPSWSEWHALVDPTTQGYYDYTVNNNGELRRYGDEQDDYKTRVLGHLAVDAINHAVRGERPLFLYVGFNAPHAPSTPPPRSSRSFAEAKAPRTPAFDEANVDDKPSFIRDRPPLSRRALARIDARYDRALASLLEVDRQVGRIVEQLRRKGQLGNTYLLFTSDNGYIDGEHRVEFGTGLPYEASARMPLLVRGPGIPGGETSDAIVGNIDLAPTIAGIADAESTIEVDGHSLLSFADHPRRENDRPLLIESLVRDRSADYGFPYEAIRDGRWLYARYSTGDEELYDLAADPLELESRTGDPDYAQVKDALAATLRRLADCRGARECSPSLPRLRSPEGG